MIKLVCESCAHVWFTSNTSNNQRCDECGEKLIEVDFVNAVKIENVETVKFNNDIHVNC